MEWDIGQIELPHHLKQHLNPSSIPEDISRTIFITVVCM